VYSSFILIETHKPHRIRQANRKSGQGDHGFRGLHGFCRASAAAGAMAWMAFQRIEPPGADKINGQGRRRKQRERPQSDSLRTGFAWFVSLVCLVGISIFAIRGIRVTRDPLLFVLFLTLSAQAFGEGFGPYSQLVVADSRGIARNGVRVTYLGTNGYQFKFGGHALLVDPYFSRVDLLSVALGARIQPNVARINDGLRHLASRADAILVTHGHFDHLLDVPSIMAKTQARLIASASSVDLAKRAGADDGPGAGDPANSRERV
jgi:hypothetical protein